MKLFYNLDNEELLDVNRQLINTWSLRYKDQLPLVIAFLRSGVVVEPTGVVIIPTLKAVGKFDSAPIAPSVSFTQTGSGESALWSGTLTVDSATIEAALKDNADASDDVTTTTASIQFYFAADGSISRSAVSACTITNSLYRGDEDFPLVVDAPALYAMAATTPGWAPAVVTLAGSDATALAGTNGGTGVFLVNHLFAMNLTTLGLKWAVLKAGTQASDYVSFVRPANYNASTYAYVFNIIG